MHIKKLAVGAVALVLAASVFVGCGGDGNGGAPGTKTGVANIAMEFDDDAKKFFPYQQKCPVDGGTIKQEFHADVNGKRVYFDKQECVDKFKQNQDEYLPELRKQMESYMRGGSPK